MRGLSGRGVDLTRSHTDMPTAGIGASGSSAMTETSDLVHPKPPSARRKSGQLVARQVLRVEVLETAPGEGRQVLLFLSATCMTACYTVAIRHARIDGLHAVAIAAVVSLLVYLPVYLAFFENGLFNVPLEGCASITAPTPITNPPASSKPPTTAPTKPFNRSSICWSRDPSLAILGVFLSLIPGARI
jgi:hypothetical protein